MPSHRLAAVLLPTALAASLSAGTWSPAADAGAPVGMHDETQAQEIDGEVGLLPTHRPKARVRTVDGRSREVGMRFRAKVTGTAVGARYYKPARARSATPRVATLWSAKGKVLARTAIPRTKGRGWRSVTFPHPAALAADTAYVVSVHTRRRGVHAATPRSFDRALRTPYLRAPARRNGVLRAGRKPAFPKRAASRDTNFWVDVRFVPAADSTTPPPPPPPATTTGWPGPDNTGVPAGTTLTPYGGPCTISAPRTLSAVDATGACDALVINTQGVVIENSLVPRVQSIHGDGDSSVTITDSDVRAGSTSTGAIWGYNITATRVDATGGQHSFHCNDNCVLVDSWMHDQYNPDSESFHNNAFISNGGSNMVLRHNTLHCTAILNSNDGGCTADVSLFGDFDPISDVTVDNNLLRANASSISYCAYGGYTPSKPYPIATNIVFTNNVFERGTNRKCGVYGPVTGFQRSAQGNVWSGNVWDSGEAVSP